MIFDVEGERSQVNCGKGRDGECGGELKAVRRCSKQKLSKISL
jgi:hypothetical protein